MRSQRTAAEPALVSPVRRWVSELECSPGVRPKYDSTSCAVWNRKTPSSAATKRTAVAGPTPGTLITRTQSALWAAM